MPLDITRLESDIKKAFEKAQKTKAPDKPEDAPKVQDQILTQLSKDLSQAIQAFVTGGDVVGIKTNVEPDPGTGKQKGTQVGTGKIQ